MPKPPPKSKNPNRANGQGSESNNPPYEKEIVMTNVVTFPKLVNNGPPKHTILVSPTHTAEIIQFTPPSRRMHPLLAEAVASNEFSPVVKRRIANAAKLRAGEMSEIEATCIFYLAEHWSTENTQQMGA